MRDKFFVTSMGVVVIAALVFIAWYARTQPLGERDGEVSVTAPTEGDWTKGNKDAKVVLIEYADFQCPGCGAYYPMVKKIMDEDGSNVYFAFRHFPLTQIHANALLAATAAEAAGKQGKFWEMHDTIFEHQSDWSSAADAKPLFTEYARTLGLDEDQFAQDISNESFRDKIKISYDEGVKLGVDRTPTFFLNGKKLKEMPKNYEEFSGLIKSQK